MIFINFGFRVILLPILLIIGVIGQVLSIKIFLSLKTWKATCKIYYLTIAIMDLAYLFAFGIPEWTGEGLDFLTSNKIKINPENLSKVSCRLFRFVWHASWFISYWTLVAYSVERLIAISNPLLRFRYINYKTAKITCSILVLIGFTTFLPIIFSEHLYTLEGEETLPISMRYCYFNNEHFTLITFLCCRF